MSCRTERLLFLFTLFLFCNTIKFSILFQRPAVMLSQPQHICVCQIYRKTATHPLHTSLQKEKTEYTQVPSGSWNPSKITSFLVLFGSSNPRHTGNECCKQVSSSKMTPPLLPLPFRGVHSEVSSKQLCGHGGSIQSIKGQATTWCPEPPLRLRFFQRLEKRRQTFCRAPCPQRLWESRVAQQMADWSECWGTAVGREKQALCDLVESGTKPH